MTIPSGKKLGRYEIRSKLGAGGIGEVHLAQDTKLDRKVALKILLRRSDAETVIRELEGRTQTT